MFKIVIIDDEEWIRVLIKSLIPFKQYPLKFAGEASDGVSGLELLKKTRPQIILTDIRMPIFSGLDLIEKMKELLPESEVIIISGFDDFAYAQKAIKLGVIEFLLKPVEAVELEKSIKKAVSNIENRLKRKLSNSNLTREVQRLSADYISLEEHEHQQVENIKIRKALKFIDMNFSKQIDLDEISDAVLLNRSYFSLLFKKELGIGFQDYLTNLRFQKAEELLEKEELHINDISLLVGFTDANYFSRVFKKRYHCTPIEFRKKKPQQNCL